MDISDEEEYYYKLDEDDYVMYCIEKTPGIKFDALVTCVRNRFLCGILRAKCVVVMAVDYGKRHNLIIELPYKSYMMVSMESYWEIYKREQGFINKR